LRPVGSPDVENLKNMKNIQTLEIMSNVSFQLLDTDDSTHHYEPIHPCSLGGNHLNPNTEPNTAPNPSKTTQHMHTPPFEDIIHNIHQPQCIKWVVSKSLSIGILSASSFLKMPQILNILNSKSCLGLNINALYFDLMSYTVTFTYNWLIKAPITTYAENFIISMQVIAIIVLSWYYSDNNLEKHDKVDFSIHYNDFAKNENDGEDEKVRKAGGNPKFDDSPSVQDRLVLLLTAYSIYVFLVLYLLPQALWTALMGVSVVLIISSRVVQITTNCSQGHAGVLSIITVSFQVLGTLVRMFTTITEVNDKVILLSFFLTFCLNFVIFLQIVFYWENSSNHLQNSHLTSNPPVYHHILSQEDSSIDMALTVDISNQVEKRSFFRLGFLNLQFLNFDPVILNSFGEVFFRYTGLILFRDSSLGSFELDHDEDESEGSDDSDLSNSHDEERRFVHYGPIRPAISE
jgi:mannose-P-dolichol utilization defect protein 1